MIVQDPDRPWSYHTAHPVGGLVRSHDLAPPRLEPAAARLCRDTSGIGLASGIEWLDSLVGGLRPGRICAVLSRGDAAVEVARVVVEAARGVGASGVLVDPTRALRNVAPEGATDGPWSVVRPTTGAALLTLAMNGASDTPRIVVLVSPGAVLGPAGPRVRRTVASWARGLAASGAIVLVADNGRSGPPRGAMASLLSTAHDTVWLQSAPGTGLVARHGRSGRARPVAVRAEREEERPGRGRPGPALH